MSITVAELLEGKGQYIVYRGAVTGEDIIASNHECLRQPEKLGQLLFVLVSFAEAESLDVSERYSQILGLQFSMMNEFVRQGIPVAIVAPTDDMFATASIWEERISSERFQVATFRESADAEVWITQKMRENFGVEIEGFLIQR